MTFVVVGGGPTGVELAGALGEISNDTLRRDFRSIHSPDARIILVEALDRILPPYPPDRSTSAARQLARLGVEVRTKTRVVEVDDRHVRVVTETGEEEIRTRTTLWAAGVQASSFVRAVAAATGAETDRAGRIIVRPDLTIPGHPEILAVGDAAVQPWKQGRNVPGVAQGAIQAGGYAGRADSGPPGRAAGLAVPVPQQGGRRRHRPAARRDQRALAGAVRAPGRVHGLDHVARDPHLLPDRVRQPDRRDGPLGVELLHQRPRHAPHHGLAAAATDRGARAARLVIV